MAVVLFLSGIVLSSSNVCPSKKLSYTLKSVSLTNKCNQGPEGLSLATMEDKEVVVFYFGSQT